MNQSMPNFPAWETVARDAVQWLDTQSTLNEADLRLLSA